MFGRAQEEQMSLRRREFIAGLGGAAAWPLAARAQQGDRVRHIGVLMPLDQNDPVGKTFVSAFTQALAGLGWTVGRNARIDLRWGGGDINNRIRALAQELVALQPDIILTGGTPAQPRRKPSPPPAPKLAYPRSTESTSFFFCVEVETARLNASLGRNGEAIEPPSAKQRAGGTCNRHHLKDPDVHLGDATV
jgi:hypothetical protein